MLFPLRSDDREVQDRGELRESGWGRIDLLFIGESRFGGLRHFPEFLCPRRRGVAVLGLVPRAHELSHHAEYGVPVRVAH